MSLVGALLVTACRDTAQLGEAQTVKESDGSELEITPTRVLVDWNERAHKPVQECIIVRVTLRNPALPVSGSKDVSFDLAKCATLVDAGGNVYPVSALQTTEMHDQGPTTLNPDEAVEDYPIFFDRPASLDNDDSMLDFVWTAGNGTPADCARWDLSSVTLSGWPD